MDSGDTHPAHGGGANPQEGDSTVGGRVGAGRGVGKRPGKDGGDEGWVRWAGPKRREMSNPGQINPSCHVARSIGAASIDLNHPRSVLRNQKLQILLEEEEASKTWGEINEHR